ncbi:MAG: hypothetical protein QMB16_04005 [Paracoccaceae bacterium]|jgi:hypothetical protein
MIIDAMKTGNHAVYDKIANRPCGVVLPLLSVMLDGRAMCETILDRIAMIGCQRANSIFDGA